MKRVLTWTPRDSGGFSEYLQKNSSKLQTISYSTFVVCFLLGISPASEFYIPTFRNTLFHLHRQVGMKYEVYFILHTYLPMKMEQMECFETSAYKIETPGNSPEESIQHLEHGESLKSGIFTSCFRQRISLVGAFAKLRTATISFVMSVCPSVRRSAWINSAPTGRIFMKFDIWISFESVSVKFQVSLKYGKNNDYFTWSPIYIFDHISLISS